MTQEEYSKSLREWRKQQRAENNMEYMERYRQQLEVGDCVYVSCDGPGPCAGRVKEITNKGITINKLRNEKVQEVLRTGGNDDPSEKDIVEAAFQNGYDGGHHYVVEADLDEVDDCRMITLPDGTEVEVADVLDVLVD